MTCQVFDGSDRPWKSTTGLDFPITGSNPDARSTITEYDANGNVRRVVNPNGVSGTCEGAQPAVADSDPQGSSPAVNPPASSAAMNASVGVYSEDGLLQSTHLPWASDAPGSTSGQNDPNGIPQRTENERRYRQDFGYTGRGLLSVVTEPHLDGAANVYQTDYRHFDSGWVSGQTEPQLQESPSDPGPLGAADLTYGYDRRGLQTLWQTRGYDRPDTDPAPGDQTPPDERRIKNTYHPSGLVASRVGLLNRSDTVEKRRYEYYYNENRSLQEIYDRLPDLAGADPSFLNRTIKVDRDFAERETDINETSQVGLDTRYDYDDDGNLILRRVDGTLSGGNYSGGRTTTFTYDELGREETMEVDDDPANPSPIRTWTTATFPSDQIDRVTRPNGVSEDLRYDASRLLVEKDTLKGSDPLRPRPTSTTRTPTAPRTSAGPTRTTPATSSSSGIRRERARPTLPRATSSTAPGRSHARRRRH